MFRRTRYRLEVLEFELQAVHFALEIPVLLQAIIAAIEEAFVAYRSGERIRSDALITERTQLMGHVYLL